FSQVQGAPASLPRARGPDSAYRRSRHHSGVLRAKELRVSWRQPARGCCEQVRPACRFRQPVSERAIEDDALGGGQIDLVSDAYVNRPYAGLRAKDGADDFALVGERSARAAAQLRLVVDSDQAALGATDRRQIQNDTDVAPWLLTATAASS